MKTCRWITPTGWWMCMVCMCTLYVRCTLSVLQKECRKVWGARYTLGARYRSENTVISFCGTLKFIIRGPDPKMCPYTIISVTSISDLISLIWEAKCGTMWTQLVEKVCNIKNSVCKNMPLFCNSVVWMWHFQPHVTS